MEVRRGWGWLLLAALTLSTIGDEFTVLSLMFRTAAEGDATGVPVLLVAELLPGLLAAPFIGRLVDAHDAGRLLVAASCCQAVVVTLAALLPAFTLPAAAVLSLLFALSGTATFALVPVLAAGLRVPLARSNAWLEIVGSIGMLAGPAAAGVLIGAIGSRATLLIDAASFALLAGVIGGSGVRRPMPPSDPSVAGRTLIAAYAELLRNRRVAVMIVVLGFGVATGAIADVAFVFLVTVSLGAGPVAFGVLTTVWAAGMLAGAAFSTRLIGARPGPSAFAAAVAMAAAALLIGAVPPTIALVAGAFLIGGAANGIHNVAVRTMLQGEAARGDHGKIAALYGAATRIATVAVYVAGGLFVPDGARDAYLLSGCMGVAAGVGGWWLFRRFGREREAER